MRDMEKGKEKTRWWEGLFGAPPAPKQVISLAGAGGKTTLLFTLGRELADRGYRVSISTTTHIFYPGGSQCRKVVTDGARDAVERALDRDRLVTVGIPAEGGKLADPGKAVLHYLREASDFLLIEADGSRRLPIKAPRPGEPVLYERTDAVAVLCGLSCLGKPVGRICQRAELAQALLGVGEEHRLTPRDAAALLYRAYGRCAERVVFLLNQADTPAVQRLAAETAGCLAGMGAERVAAASFRTGWLRVFR